MPTQDTWTSIAGTYTGSYFSRRRDWVRTPNFGSLDRDELPVNVYNDKRTFYSQESRGVTYYQDGGGVHPVAGPGYLYTGTQIESVSDSYISSKSSDFLAKISAEENRAMIRLLGKIADRKVDIGVMAAEAAKTSDLIYDAARRLDGAYRAFRRGQFRKVARLLNITPGRIHKNWLEYKYGWMPLLMDVRGMAEAYASHAVDRPDRFSESVTAQLEGSYANTYELSTLPWANRVITESLTFQWKLRMKIWLEITNPAASQLQQLGVTNPAVIAWELIPFSFVFDWFISVGDYLQGLTALHGLTIRRTMRSNTMEYDYSWRQPANTRVANGVTYYNAAFNFDGPKKYYGRGNLTVDPTSLYPPVSSGVGSFDRLITSLALIKGSYRGNLRI